MGFFSKDSKGKSDSRYEGGGHKRPSSAGRYDNNKTLTRVNCDACGASCQVPFKPASGKPVYCNDCFRKGDNSERPSAPRRFSDSDNHRRSSEAKLPNKELEQINAKLDKILALLEQ